RGRPITFFTREIDILLDLDRHVETFLYRFLGVLSEGNPPKGGEDFMQRELPPRQREAPSHRANWSLQHRGLDSLPQSGGFEKDKRHGQSHRPKQDRFDYQDGFNQNRFHFVSPF